MRKLGILIATMAVALFGFAGTAQADGHQDTVCANVPSEQDAQDNAPGGEPGPFDDVLRGANESCNETNLDDLTSGNPNPALLCESLEGVYEVTGEISGDIEDGIKNELLGALGDDNPCQETDPSCVENCGNGPPPEDDDENNNDGGGSPDPEVKGKNQTADGGLPRTGGELFAGAGLGLAGLGTFLRRFLLR